MNFFRGDIFRVISGAHPMLADAARAGARLVVEDIEPGGDFARLAFLDRAGDKTASAVLGLDQLRAAFLLRDDIARAEAAPGVLDVVRLVAGRRPATLR